MAKFSQVCRLFPAAVLMLFMGLASSAVASDFGLLAQGEDAAAAVMGLGMMICCVIVSFSIPALIAYFVYADAVKNKVENPVLWAVVCFFTGLIGLLIYFLAIRPKYVK